MEKTNTLDKLNNVSTPQRFAIFETEIRTCGKMVDQHEALRARDRIVDGYLTEINGNLRQVATAILNEAWAIAPPPGMAAGG